MDDKRFCPFTEQVNLSKKTFKQAINKNYLYENVDIAVSECCGYVFINAINVIKSWLLACSGK